jgi:pantothenate kinase
MESLVNGMAFIIENAKDPSFRYSDESGEEKFEETTETFPKLLVNIGSGVSIIKVNSQNSFERISGTCVGGGKGIKISIRHSDWTFESPNWNFRFRRNTRT